MHERYCALNVKKCSTCLEVVNIKDYEEHVQRHNNNKHNDVNAEKFGVQIKCDYCNMLFTQNEYDEHIKVCECKNVECRYCKMKIDFDLLIAHEDDCGARTTKCPKCKMYVVTKDYEEHVKKGKCRKQNENAHDNEMNIQQYRMSCSNNNNEERNKEYLRERDKYDERTKRIQQRYDKENEEVRNERVKRKEDKKFDVEKEMEIMQLKRDLMVNHNHNNNNNHYHHRDYNNDDYYKKRLHYHSRDDNRRNIRGGGEHNYNHHNNHNYNNHNNNNYDIKDNYQLHYNYNQMSSNEYKHQHNGDYLDDLYKKYTKSKEKATNNNNNTNKYVDNNIEDEEEDIVNITHNMKQIFHSNPKPNVNVHHNRPISLAITSQSKEKDINNNNHLDLYFDYKKRHTRPNKASINHANSLTHANNNIKHNHHNNRYHYQQIPEKDTNRLALEIEHLNQIIRKDNKRGTTQPNKVTTTQEREYEHEQHKAICLYKRQCKDNANEYKLRNQNFPFKNDSHLNSNVTENHYNYYKTKHHSNTNNK